MYFRQADDTRFSWLDSYSEVGATLVIYRVPVTESPVHRSSAARRNISLHRAICHDAVLALYHCARARWLATSGDSCQCMTGRDDFLSTLSHVSAGRCWLLMYISLQYIHHLIGTICLCIADCHYHLRMRRGNTFGCVCLSVWL